MLKRETMRVPISEACPGDILIFKGRGIAYKTLSYLLRKLKEPNWDGWGWHMAPVISRETRPYLQIKYMDAQWPRLKITTLRLADKVRCYRVFDTEPPADKVKLFVDRVLGRSYDVMVHFWTMLALFLRPRINVPRIINRFYDCWECTFEALDQWGIDITWTWEYPWLTDFLRHVKEIK